MSIITLVLIVIVALIIVSVIAFSVRIVPQSKAYVVERIGAYNRTCGVRSCCQQSFFKRTSC